MKTINRAIGVTCTAFLLFCMEHRIWASDAVWTASSGLWPTNASPAWYYNLFPPASATLTSGVLRLEGHVAYFQDLDTLQIPTNLIIEARMRFVSGDSSVSGQTSALIYFYTQHGIANRLYIGKDEIFVNSPPLVPHGPRVRGAVANVDTDDSPHDYRIEVHGTANGSSFNVFYDGALTLTGSLFLDDDDQEPEIAWGDIYSAPSGVSEWLSFKHNASAAPEVAIFTAAEICWPSQTDRTYQVQWATSLPATNWMNLQAPIAGTGSNICIFDSTRGSGRRFYRVDAVR